MTVDFGARTSVVRRGPVALRVRIRTLVVCVALLCATLAVGVVALCLGDLPLSAVEVVRAIVGRLLLGDDGGLAGTVVFDWRAPRVLGAMVFGAALGVSGAVFQSMTRNPLASPDIIGLSAGSYAGGLIVIILLGGGAVATAIGSIAGGLLAAALVYVLAYRRGVHGFRLIVVGIGVSAMLGALSTYLVLRARLEVAMAAAIWGAGSMNPVGWSELMPSLAVIVLVFGALVVLARPLRQLELGDDAAASLGTQVERTRLALVVCAVALTAVVTAAAGPIAFVALAAPQIGRRLSRSPGVALLPSAFFGAFVLTSSDVVAQHALPQSLPVGVVTVVVGGGYLVWLLIHEARRR